MKKRLLIALGIVFATLTINAQTMEKEYYNHQIELQLNGDSLQTIEGDGMKVELKITPSIEQPDPKKIQPFEWRMFPKPESIVKKRNKVIVVFDRKQWDAFHYMHRRMWLRKGEVHKRVEESKQK